MKMLLPAPFLLLGLLPALCSSAAVSPIRRFPPLINMTEAQIAETLMNEDTDPGIAGQGYVHPDFDPNFDPQSIEPRSDFDDPDDDSDFDPDSTNSNSTSLANGLEARGTWGGFLDSCYDIRFQLSDKDLKALYKKNVKLPYLDSPYLTARCIELSQKARCSWLKLGHCMQNRGGFLLPGKGGHFHESCPFCRIVEVKEKGKKTIVLRCNCYRDYVKSPVLYMTEVDLSEFFFFFFCLLFCLFGRTDRSFSLPLTDEIIHNWDGRLRCYSFRGTGRPCPWLDSYDFMTDDGHYNEKADYDA